MASKTYSFGYNVTIIPTPPEPTSTVTFVIMDLAEAYGWESSSTSHYYNAQYPTSGSPKIDMTMTGQSSGMFLSGTRGTWTMQDSASGHGQLIISMIDPTKKILSIIPRFSTTSHGYCTCNGTQISSLTELTPDSNSITFQANTQSGYSRNGQVRFSEFTITYEN